MRPILKNALLILLGCAIGIGASVLPIREWLFLPTEKNVISQFEAINKDASKDTIAIKIHSLGGDCRFSTHTINEDLWRTFEFQTEERRATSSYVQTRIPIRPTNIFPERLWAVFLFDSSGRLIAWRHRNFLIAP